MSENVIPVDEIKIENVENIETVVATECLDEYSGLPYILIQDPIDDELSFVEINEIPEVLDNVKESSDWSLSDKDEIEKPTLIKAKKKKKKKSTSKKVLQSLEYDTDEDFVSDLDVSLPGYVGYEILDSDEIYESEVDSDGFPIIVPKQKLPKSVRKLPTPQKKKRNKNLSRKPDVDDDEGVANGIYPCDGCSRRFNTVVSLRNHLVDFHRWSKQKADQIHPKQEDESLKINIDFLMKKPGTSDKPKPMMFLCEKCPKSYASNSSLQNHIATIHDNKPVDRTKYKCKLCPKTSSNAGNLRSHIQYVHLSIKPFQCSQCSKTFKRPIDLMRHNKTVHEKIRPFKCHICAKELSAKQILARHIISVHENGKPYKCPLCPETFRWIQQRSQHKYVVHNVGKLYTRTKRVGAGLAARKAKALRMQQLMGKESTAPTCQHCSKKFSQQTLLDKHIRREHEAPKPFQCPQCPMSFRSEVSRQRHINEEHSMNKSLRTECPHCGKKYFNFYIQAHINAVHLKEKKFPCPICKKMFGYKTDVPKHIERSHNQTPVPCNICEKTFTSVSIRDHHIKVMHENAMPIHCTLCPMIFKYDCNLILHMKKCHKKPETLTSGTQSNKPTINVNP